MPAVSVLMGSTGFALTRPNCSEHAQCWCAGEPGPDPVLLKLEHPPTQPAGSSVQQGSDAAAAAAALFLPPPGAEEFDCTGPSIFSHIRTGSLVA